MYKFAFFEFIGKITKKFSNGKTSKSLPFDFLVF